jgi:hypothetical protein
MLICFTRTMRHSPPRKKGSLEAEISEGIYAAVT